MPPKTESKGFRKGKAKAKGKAKKKQIVYVRAKQSQPRALPAFSATPQGLPGGVYTTPGIVVAPQVNIPMAKPEAVPDNTNQILEAYNNLLVQGAQAAQAQRFQQFTNRGGLNIQRPEYGFRSTATESNIYGTTPIPSGYILSDPGIEEQAIDALTYDNPKINDVIENELDYAPQLPDVSSSASSSGMALTEKQDNALSNLVSKERLSNRDKQVQKDLDNADEKDQEEGVWFDTIPKPLTPAEKRRQTMQKKKAAEFSAKSQQTQRDYEAFLAAEGPVGINPFNLPTVRLTAGEAGKPYTFV